MSTLKRNIIIYSFLTLSSWYSSQLYAQGVAQPLTIQGMDQFIVQGVRSTAMGGSSIAIGKDASSLFTNPASLAFITKPEFRLGSAVSLYNNEQWQDWIPNELYAELTLLFENEQIVKIKPYDTIKPYWKKSSKRFTPSLGVASIPLEIYGINIVPAFGVIEVIDLNHYFQNNNALSPNIGQMRPAPIPRPAANETVRVDWFQYINKRVGSIYGITPGLALQITEDFSVGASLAFLSGSTEDAEEKHRRGNIKLTTVRNSNSSFNNFFVDSSYYHKLTSGISEYEGVIPQFGLHYRQRYYSFGATLKPSWELKRSWSSTIHTYTDTAISIVDKMGNDKITFPLNINLGLALFPTKNWTIGIDFDKKDYSNVKYQVNPDSSTKPWLSSQRLRLGAEYRPLDWLALRGGYREDILTVAAEGAALLQNPTKGAVYTAGCGLVFGNINIDFAYEYTLTQFQDTWLSNINYNKKEKHRILVETGIKF